MIEHLSREQNVGFKIPSVAADFSRVYIRVVLGVVLRCIVDHVYTLCKMHRYAISNIYTSKRTFVILLQQLCVAV